MAIKRYLASKDTTITNALRSNLTTTMTSSNMGASDSLEIFYIAKQANSSSQESSRILIEFPISSIVADRSAGNLPSSGSVDFYIKLSNVAHPFTLPRQYTLMVAPISQSWTEGIGLDMEEGYDLGPANWISASNGVAWTNAGGDFITSSVYSQYFDVGHEDLEVNISPLVEQWIDGTYNNYGVGIYLTSSQETGDDSYYTKKFSARGTEYFFNRPVIEARWDSSKKDDRGFFYASSSMADATENLNTLYLYNNIRGQLRNIPAIGQGELYVKLYDAPVNGQELTSTPNNPVTGGWLETGVYTASVALDTTASVIYDVWYSGSEIYHTGTINIRRFNEFSINTNDRYTSKITNLKKSFSRQEEPTLRLFTRKRDWQPNIYTVTTRAIRPDILEDVYYQVERIRDEKIVIPFGTGSVNHTRLSYDASGSYFKFDMTLLEEDYMYQFVFAYNENSEYKLLPETFKFRIDK